MTAQKIEESGVVADHGEFLNEVRLRGRVAEVPQERELAGGDRVLNLRLTVARAPGKTTTRQKSDSVDCTVRVARLKKSVASWGVGDLVEVTGTLHHRFFRTGGTTASRVEVELDSARVTRRAATG